MQFFHELEELQCFRIAACRLWQASVHRGHDGACSARCRVASNDPSASAAAETTSVGPTIWPAAKTMANTSSGYALSTGSSVASASRLLLVLKRPSAAVLCGYQAQEGAAFKAAKGRSRRRPRP